VAAQLEIVLLDGSQGGGGGSVSPSGTPPASAPPVPQSPTPQQPQPTQPAPSVTPAPGRPAMPDPVPGADRSVADTLDLPSLDEVARHLEEMAERANSPDRAYVETDRARFEEADANYRHENPEPIGDIARGAATKATDTVQEAIEEITGGAQQALERLEQLIREAREVQPRQEASPRDTVGRAIGRNLAGRFGNRLRRSRLGRMATRVGRSRAGRAVGGAVGRAVLSRGAATGASAAAGTSAAGGALAAVGAVAIPVAATVAALGAFAIALRAATAVAASFGDEIEDVSPEVARQRNVAETERFISRTERAERIGPAVAQVEAAQMRIDEAMYEVQTEIYALIAKAAPLIEIGADGITAMLRGLLLIKETIDVAVTLGGDPQQNREQAQAQARFAQAFNDIFRENEPIQRDADLMALFNQDIGPKPDDKPKPNGKPRIRLVP
jgi:hypothetical protein